MRWIGTCAKVFLKSWSVMKILGMFPGQGSQKVGMGKNYLTRSPLADKYFDEADTALGFKLSQMIFEGPAEELTKTAIAQPAILTVSCIAHAIHVAESNPELCAVLGHSLGEYSALVAAGSLAFKDAVKLVHLRGKYMQEAVPVGTGRMVAVLGKELSEIESAAQQVKGGIAQVANINAPGQIVVAGDKAGIDQFTSLLAGAKIIELQVSAPFHCALMKPAADKLLPHLNDTNFQAPKMPVIANFSATEVRSPDEIRKSLYNQVCGRVRWIESMEYAVKNYQPEIALEYGEGNTLQGLLKRINPALNKDSAIKA
jgi:[acyl-carrier-protein] S-malonyltransferase